MTHPRRQALHIAADIREAFDRHQRAFAAVTKRAQERFLARDWREVPNDLRERLDLYARTVDASVARLRARQGPEPSARATWAGAKEAFTALIAGRRDQELAQTFFNSVCRRVLAIVGQDPLVEFTSSPPPPSVPERERVRKRFAAGTGARTPALLQQVIESFGLRAAFRGLESDCLLAAERIDAALRALGAGPLTTVEVLEPLFVRNKGAYIIGRVHAGERWLPIALALVHPEDGIAVDAVLLDERGMSMLFSLAHSYFHADIDDFAATIAFLRVLMPRKRDADLYIALGHNKHGKTELYRDLRAHLAGSDDALDFAPGRRGMVMIVFGRPSYDHVFKVIKDRFDPPKQGTRARVIANYRLVFHRDRVGRLIDAQEFEDLELDCRRLAPELLATLLRDAAEVVEREGERVLFKHLYIEARVTPLDIFVRGAPRPAALEALLDYGAAIKNLAAADIFPGDLFLKNFGVTRSGRVVFYDYDELCLLSECNFRRLPAPRSPEEELADEPWFAVADNDIFPEEILSFLGLPDELREPFLRAHGDLFDVDFWRRTQELHVRGAVLDVYPYRSEHRLTPTRATRAAGPHARESSSAL